MIKIKLCGLSRECDMEAANRLRPDYIGFVFAPGSRRYVSPERAATLKSLLDPEIMAVGVFVNEAPEKVAELLDKRIIDLAQLHGQEDEDYIARLRALTDRPLIKAFRIDSAEDVEEAAQSSADFVLLDSGNGGTGSRFDWRLISDFPKPYFLAGGLSVENVSEAIEKRKPYALDVSSGIETKGVKDKDKMAAFVAAVRKEVNK